MKRPNEARTVQLERLPTTLFREIFSFRRAWRLLRLPKSKCCFFWIKENLHYVTELEDCPPHVMIWAGLTAGLAQARTSFIQPSTVLYIWKSWVIFDTRADNMGDHGKRVVSARWRSDFTPPVREFLNEVFPSLWILCGFATSPSPLAWPSCKPDFTTPGEILWGINTDEPTRCNNDLLIYKISLTCFGQYFAYHQERETEIFTAYVILLLWWAGRRWVAAWHYVPTTTAGYHML